MIRFMIVTFLILGWAFYEMSGGADFVPEERIAAAPSEETPAAPAETVVASVPATNETGQTAPVITETTSIQDRLSTALVTSAVTQAIEAPSETAPAAGTIAALVADEADLPLAPETDEPVETELTDAIAEPAVIVPDLRQVAGSRVNMRSGPSTDFSVLATLDGGTTTEVLESNDDGWVLVRVQNTGQEGWMAERLLEQVNG